MTALFVGIRAAVLAVTAQRPVVEKYDVREFVGIAADEQYRLERKRNKSANHVHPLVDWNMTEAECLNYCYEKGFDWGATRAPGGLYEHFHRVILLVLSSAIA